MELSASSLSSLTKCSYKYKLERVDGLDEPGKKSFNMLMGKVMETAVQNGSQMLNERKTMTATEIAEVLFRAFEVRFIEVYDEGILTSLLPPIRTILLEGAGTGAEGMLDNDMPLLSCCELYEYKMPAVLKTGGYSKNAKTPTMSARVHKAYEDLVWFFSDDNPYLEMIRHADVLQEEKKFAIPVGDPVVTTINGQDVVEQDTVMGYMDQWMTCQGKQYATELKYVSTPYTQAFVDINIQPVLYQIAMERDGSNMPAEITLFDLAHRRWFTINVEDKIKELTLRRFVVASKQIREQLYIPVCGTDPYNTGNVLCGFKKCGGCEFAPAVDTMEDAA